MGRAVAANQCEGAWDIDGKGVSVADVVTAGTNGVKRQITDGVIEGDYFERRKKKSFEWYKK